MPLKQPELNRGHSDLFLWALIYGLLFMGSYLWALIYGLYFLVSIAL